MLIVLFFLCLTPVRALIGYDCGTQSLNITTLSLLEVGPCDIPESTLNVTKQYLQVLQINEYTETMVYQCKLEVHRTIYHCGMYSHSSVVRYGEMEYIYEISRKVCQDVYLTGVLNFQNTHVMNGIRVNRTKTFPMVFAGAVDSDGSCNGAAFADPYGSWENVLVQGTLKITVQEQLARVSISGDKIHFRSGTACPLSDGTCIDVEGGHTFWHPIPTDNCKFHQYGVLYEGYATKITNVLQPTQAVYTLSTDDVTFALTSTTKELVCGYVIKRTDHPKLVVFETTKGETFATKSSNSVNNLDIFAYINSKFVYVERHVRTQIQRLYRDALMHRCELERKTLKNSLAIATHAPDQFAYNLMKGPGYMALVAGEVVHIIKCVPVDVKLEHGENCYVELQVSKRNVTYFLTPMTHILKTRGTQVEYNHLLPSHYFLDEAWYKILPKSTTARDPIVIKPMAKPTWTYISPASLATSGIYSEKDLSDLRDHIMFPIEKPAILNDFAREIHGHPITDKEGTLSQLLNEDSLDKIVESTGLKIWHKFITFGSASAGVIAILMVVQGIKMLIEVIVQGYALHRLYGWSIYLLGALWSSVAQFLINLRTTNPPRAPSQPRRTSHAAADIERATKEEISVLYAPEEKKEEHQVQIVTQPRATASGFFSI